MAVAKVIEISSASNKSFEDAVQQDQQFQRQNEPGEERGSVYLRAGAIHAVLRRKEKSDHLIGLFLPGGMLQRRPAIIWQAHVDLALR